MEIIKSLTSENKLERARAVESFNSELPSSETFHLIHDTFYGRAFSIKSTPWEEFDGLVLALTKIYNHEIKNPSLEHREGEIEGEGKGSKETGSKVS